MAGKPKPGGPDFPEMLSVRINQEGRIQLDKLARSRRQSVSVVLRTLIAQAAAQRNTKSVAIAAAQSTTENAA